MNQKDIGMSRTLRSREVFSKNIYVRICPDIPSIAPYTTHYIEEYDNSLYFCDLGGEMAKLESQFSLELREELKHRFPGCFIVRLDPQQFQGIPDLLVLWGRFWAILETKRGLKSVRQPNQEFYVDMFDEMSFSAFVHPLNYRDVLDEMERAFSL